MDRRINVDVNVLCHLVEFLAGSVILARVRFNLHNVVLPRGWILALLRQIVMREADTMLLDRLLSSMKALLEGLVTGDEEASALFFLLLSKVLSKLSLPSEYILFEGHDAGGLPTLSSLFIHRMQVFYSSSRGHPL